MSVIERDRSLIVSCDVPIGKLASLVEETHEVEGIGGYKVGAISAIGAALPCIRKLTLKGERIIYHHGSGASDIPRMGRPFMQACRDAGTDAVVIAGTGGPAAIDAWVGAARRYGIDLIAEPEQIGKPDYISEGRLGALYANLWSKGIDEFILPEGASPAVRGMLEGIGATIYTRDEQGVSEFPQGMVEIPGPEMVEEAIPRLHKVIRKHTDLPIIYDHQTAGSFAPYARHFASAMQGGADAAILIPQWSDQALDAHLEQLCNKRIPSIIGGLMTHPQFLASEGGFIDDVAMERIYRIGAEVENEGYIVPGNNPSAIREIRILLESLGQNPIFYSPGFVTQGGEISEAGKAAGNRWHAIVGSAIYKSRDPHEAARALCRQL